jgi:hypothetical protein
MNLLIQELAEQAGIFKPEQFRQHIDALQLEKFAELIVKECARIASNTNLEDVDGGDSAVLGAAREQILEHFGVEE